MIISIVFASLVLLHLSLLIYGRAAIRTASYRKLFLYLLLLGLIYDNLVLALGNMLVGTDIFLLISLPRFVLHATILPFLALFSFSTMQVAGVPFSDKVRIPVFAFTALALGYGLFHDVLGLDLGPVEKYGHWHMTNLAGGPPLATIATNIIAIIMGALVWRAKGPFWLFAGAVFAFVLNTLAAPHPWSFISSNLIEVVFVFCLLKGEISLGRSRKPD